MQKISNKQYIDWSTNGNKAQKALAQTLKDCDLVSEGKKAHYSEDMWKKEAEVMKSAQVDGKYHSYENKNGVTYECRFYFRKCD